jgi:hypothetical protein
MPVIDFCNSVDFSLSCRCWLLLTLPDHCCCWSPSPAIVNVQTVLNVGHLPWVATASCQLPSPNINKIHNYLNLQHARRQRRHLKMLCTMIIFWQFVFIHEAIALDKSCFIWDYENLVCFPWLESYNVKFFSIHTRFTVNCILGG